MTQDEPETHSPQVEVLRVITRAVAAARDSDDLASRVCQIAVSSTGADGASITIATGEPERFTLCASDDTAARLEDLQEVLGQGPTVDAYRSDRIQRFETADPGERTRLGASVREVLGECVVHAVPIRSARGPLGVLTLYLRGTGGLRIDAATLQLLANALGTAISNDEELLDPLETSASWKDRSEIHQATGMVLTQLRISPDDAMVLLRAHAYSNDQTLHETALDVVERRLDFTTIDPDPGRRS